MPKERYGKLKEYLSLENPILTDVITHYEQLDKLGHAMGFIGYDETYKSHISWWPMISILGTFSAGKSTFINHYVGKKIQESGNQAVDDKFTVVCYGNNEEAVTLPGLALDADPRFPFYNISQEVNKVDPGEGNRVNLYLQLKTLKSDKLKGKILIDSPGFDADSQRDGILRITDHIVNMSDLVLIFFDARHPEPGAMRDTLEHLVAATLTHRDANKVLYILNQIDTTAKEDNLEDVIGSWQRALSQKGLVSGNFYSIYNENAANIFEDEVQEARLKNKKDNDLAQITERMDKIKIERAYRIIKAVEDFAQTMKDVKIPLLQEALLSWSKKVFWSSGIVLALLVSLFIALEIQFDLSNSLEIFTGVLGATIFLFLMLHFKIRNFFARTTAKKWESKDPEVAKAILYKTKWWHTILGLDKSNWKLTIKKQLDELSQKSRAAIQKLNDQFISPSGHKEEA